MKYICYICNLIKSKINNRQKSENFFKEYQFLQSLSLLMKMDNIPHLGGSDVNINIAVMRPQVEDYCYSADVLTKPHLRQENAWK